MIQRIKVLAVGSGGEQKEKRADVERAVTSRFISHICSYDSVASHILGRAAVEAASKSNQLFKATKCKRSTTHERLYRNECGRYFMCESGGRPDFARPIACPKS
jgi:hypothetical protein